MVVLPKARLPGAAPATPGATIVGVLAFEAAAAMSRLVSLHRSLSDAEVSNLRSQVMRSPGVAYLVSTDQSFLLRLACAELLDDLDRAADTVARIAPRCAAPLARGFPRTYAELMSGSVDDTDRAWRGARRRVKKMERLITATAQLWDEMEALDELEAAERRWARARHRGPIPDQSPGPACSSDSLRLELKSRRQKVRRLKEESLWGQTFDKTTGIMAESAFAAFARICAVFGPSVQGLPWVHVTERTRINITRKLRLYRRSGPLERWPVAPSRKVPIKSSSCPIFHGEKMSPSLVPKLDIEWKSKALEAQPGTVGGAGLALRYANVVAEAERLLRAGAGAAAVERKELYGMLPAALRARVRAKLRECWRGRGPLDESLAAGWREAAGRILGWLGPVAADTVRWEAERSMDRGRRFDAEPRALTLQTLRLADREKTEAAIAEVLVGLSCVCWYEERRSEPPELPIRCGV